MPSFSLANLSVLSRPERSSSALDTCEECRRLNRGNVSDVKKYCKKHRDPATCGEDFEAVDEFELPQVTEVIACEDDPPEADPLEFCLRCRIANVYNSTGVPNLCAEHRSPFDPSTVVEVGGEDVPKMSDEPWVNTEFEKVEADKTDEKDEEKQKNKTG